MSEGEDRTQGPSTQRRQQARERGQVAHSAELTAAVGLLAAVAALGTCGEALASALVALLREPLLAAPGVVADPAAVVAHLRHLAFEVAGPLVLVMSAPAVAALLAHQVQVGGLLVPSLLAPDLARLWSPGRGEGWSGRAARAAWSAAKAAAVVTVAAWSIRSGWLDAQQLGAMEIATLAHRIGGMARRLAFHLASATLALGVLDFALRHRRFEESLRMTPDESREDQRSVEGDPALRARRRQLARARRGDPAELFKGASLVLNGQGGLTLVLAGGPPPRPAYVRAAQQGAAGLKLRLAAEAAGIPRVDAHELARRLARRASPSMPIPPEAMTAVAALWPTAEPSVPGTPPPRGPAGIRAGGLPSA